jgi:hypothetical protein
MTSPNAKEGMQPAGTNSILPKEHGSMFYMLPVVKNSDKDVSVPLLSYVLSNAVFLTVGSMLKFIILNSSGYAFIVMPLVFSVLKSFRGSMNSIVYDVSHA